MVTSALIWYSKDETHKIDIFRIYNGDVFDVQMAAGFVDCNPSFDHAPRNYYFG
jgi:hypothetical protein